MSITGLAASPGTAMIGPSGCVSTASQGSASAAATSPRWAISNRGGSRRQLHLGAPDGSNEDLTALGAVRAPPASEPTRSRRPTTRAHAFRGPLGAASPTTSRGPPGDRPGATSECGHCRRAPLRPLASRMRPRLRAACRQARRRRTPRHHPVLIAGAGEAARRSDPVGRGARGSPIGPAATAPTSASHRW
jgi:hypothetical protein